MNTVIPGLVRRVQSLVAGRAASAAVVFGALAVYGLGYLPLRAWVGMSAGLLAAVPVILGGLVFGLRGGLLIGVAIPLLNGLLLNLAGQPGWDMSVRETRGVGPLVAIALGALIGYWSDQTRTWQQASAALRASEERYRLLVETARDVVFALSPTGVFTMLNPAFEVFTGWPRADWLGRPFAGLIIAGDQSSAVSYFQRVLNGEALRAIRLRVPTQAGASLVVEFNLAPQLKAGQVIGLLGIARDMTQEQLTEDTLKANEARFRALTEATTEGLAFHDQGRILDVNPALVAMFGYAAAAVLVGRDWLDLVAPAARAHVQERLHADAPGPWEALGQRQDGSVFPLEATARWYDYQGRATQVVSLHDITDRKRAEQALRDSQARLAGIIDSAMDAIISLDAEQRVILFNPAAEQLFRCSAAEALGQPVERFIPTPFRARHHADVQTFGQTTQTRRTMSGLTAFTCLRSTGEAFVAEVSISQIDMAGQKIYTAILRDATERQEAEKKLAASESKLRAVFAAMQDVVVIIDQNGIYREIAPTSPGLLARPPEDLLGKSLAEIFSAPQAEQFLSMVRAVIQSRAARQLEYPLQLGDRWVWFSANLTPIGEAAVVWVARDITERKQAEEAFRRRADEFAALYDTARDLAAQHDLPTLLKTIVERARALLRAQGGGIYLYDPARGDLEMALAVGTSVPTGARLRLGEGLAGLVAQTRQPLIVDDYRTWAGRAAQFAAVPFRAVVQAPMLYAGELIGVVVAHEVGDSPRTFTEADAHLLAVFGEYAASAVHTEHLFSETRRRLTELEAVARVSAALRTAQVLDDMLPRLLDETLAVLATTAGSVALYDPARAEIRPAVGRGWMATIAQMPLQPGEGIGGQVFVSGEVYRVAEFGTDPYARRLADAALPAGWGGVCLPIRTAREVVGVMFIAVPLPRELTEAEIYLLMTLMEIAGNAIHRTRLHEQTERNLQRLAALRAIDVVITSSLDLRMTLNILLGHTLTQLNVHAADVLLLEASTQMLTYAAGSGFRSAALSQSRVALGNGPAGYAALERRLVNIADLRKRGTGFLREALLTGEDFVAYYGVPLIAKGVVQGVLEIFHRAPLTPDAEWLSFLDALAGQAAIAIDNAELFERLQRSNAELAVAYDATIEGWARALELRDRETEGHTRRVTELFVQLARAVGVGEAELPHLRRGALLHDIGKMAVPDSILLKPAALTEDEWVLMRQHPQHAYDMLSPIIFLRPALDIPYCHHEKWDGTGYPRGLRGEQIPLAARIFAVADVWDALRSDRPYRLAWPEAQVRGHIAALAGTHFDPAIVKVFQALPEGGALADHTSGPNNRPRP